MEKSNSKDIKTKEVKTIFWDFDCTLAVKDVKIKISDKIQIKSITTYKD